MLIKHPLLLGLHRITFVNLGQNVTWPRGTVPRTTETISHCSGNVPTHSSTHHACWTPPAGHVLSGSVGVVLCTLYSQTSKQCSAAAAVACSTENDFWRQFQHVTIFFVIYRSTRCRAQAAMEWIFQLVYAVSYYHTGRPRWSFVSHDHLTWTTLCIGLRAVYASVLLLRRWLWPDDLGVWSCLRHSEDAPV